MRLLAIDPGTRRTGWAVFQVDLVAKYVCSSVIEIKNKELSWIQRIDFIVIKVFNLLSSYKIDRVIIEQPETFIGSQRGNAAANTGTVAKLMALVFAIRTAVKYYKKRKVEVVLIPVRKWKGNVPKEVTQKRIKRYWGLDIESLDEADSIGLADYYVRKVLRVEKI